MEKVPSMSTPMQMDPSQLPLPPQDLIPRPYVILVPSNYVRCSKSLSPSPTPHWTRGNYTHTSIKICHHPGPFLIVASCVTEQAPYRAHPNRLFGRVGDHGVRFIYGMAVSQTTEHEFNLDRIGILRAAEDDKVVEVALRERFAACIPQLRPGQLLYTGDTRNDGMPKTFDLGVVRLAFQVFVWDNQSRGFEGLEPLVSDPIHIGSSVPRPEQTGEIPILVEEAMPTVGTVAGGTVMIILFAIKKNAVLNLQDLKVVFYDEGEPQWMAEANNLSVRKGIMVVHTPAYGGTVPPTQGRIPVKFVVRSNLTRSCTAPGAFRYEVDHLPSSTIGEETSSEAKSESKPKRIRKQNSMDVENCEDASEDDSSEEDEFNKYFGIMKV